MTIKRLAGFALFVAVVVSVLFGMTPNVTGQARAEAVKRTRLYVFDCGFITVADPKSFGLQKEEVVPWIDKISVASFLIVNPRGTLLWETGVLPDAQVQPGNPRGITKTLTTMAAAKPFPALSAAGQGERNCSRGIQYDYKITGCLFPDRYRDRGARQHPRRSGCAERPRGQSGVASIHNSVRR